MSDEPETTERPRGAIASPRHKLAGAAPHAATPCPANYAALAPQISYWGNQRDGDCVSAEEAAAKACYSVARGISEVFVTEADLVTWARKHRYLNGAMLTDVMDTMQTDGLPANGKTYTDGPYTSVDWTDYPTLTSAIYQGPVEIGIAASQVERAAGGTTGWWLTTARKDHGLDHCVGLVGYGTAAWCATQLKTTVPQEITDNHPCVIMFTWNTFGILTHEALIAICGEAWLRTPTTIPDEGPSPPDIGPNPNPLMATGSLADIGDAAQAVKALADAVMAKGLVVTVWGVEIKIQVAK